MIDSLPKAPSGQILRNNENSTMMRSQAQSHKFLDGKDSDDKADETIFGERATSPYPAMTSARKGGARSGNQTKNFS